MSSCETYLEDPEANAAHVQSCAACAALFGELDEEIAARPVSVNVDALPFAPWEGASHRTWPLVIAGAIALLVLATVFFFAAGFTSPRGLANVLFAEIPPVQDMPRVLQLWGQGIGIPLVAVLFLGINTILFLLLRRTPKGIDV
ncbi:MAG TPA: hypothetical protein VNA69_14150 [Thermoanaerobaculia bacterium]|nr:hypothetical protein [Thermoanaerobaculia bacterium]